MILTIILVCMYMSGSKRFSTLSDTQTPLLPIFPLAFIQVSFVHGILYSFHPVFLRSSSCSLLFRHPIQCYFGQSFFCHSLNMAIPCELVLFNLFYNCFLSAILLSYSYVSNSIFSLFLIFQRIFSDHPSLQLPPVFYYFL